MISLIARQCWTQLIEQGSRWPFQRPVPERTRTPSIGLPTSYVSYAGIISIVRAGEFLAAAFFTRLALIVAFKTYAHPGAWEYETIANNLLAGRGFSYVFLKTT